MCMLWLYMYTYRMGLDITINQFPCRRVHRNLARAVDEAISNYGLAVNTR